MYDVSIVKCDSYAPEDCERALSAVLEPLGGLDWVRSGMRIVIKANLVSAMKPDAAATTHPALLRALTQALQARGAATESLIVNISRQGLIYIPSMFILGAIFHETGLIWAQPVADVLSLLLAIGLYFCMSGKGND